MGLRACPLTFPQASDGSMRGQSLNNLLSERRLATDGLISNGGLATDGLISNVSVSSASSAFWMGLDSCQSLEIWALSGPCIPKGVINRARLFTRAYKYESLPPVSFYIPKLSSPSLQLPALSSSYSPSIRRRSQFRLISTVSFRSFSNK